MVFIYSTSQGVIRKSTEQKKKDAWYQKQRLLAPGVYFESQGKTCLKNLLVISMHSYVWFKLAGLECDGPNIPNRKSVLTLDTYKSGIKSEYCMKRTPVEYCLVDWTGKNAYCAGSNRSEQFGKMKEYK